MPVPITTLLGVPNLISMIQTVKTGLPRVLPDPFYNVTRNVEKDFASFRQYRGIRQLAKAAKYGAPSRVVGEQDIADVPVKLLHTVHNQQFGQIVLDEIARFESQGAVIVGQDNARDEVVRQTREFKARFENLRTTAIGMAILKGSISFRADGTVLPSAAGASYTLDFQTPAANVGTVASVLQPYAPTKTYKSWDDPSADILGALVDMMTYANQVSTYPLKYAMFGGNIASRITANATASALLIRDARYRDTALGGNTIPNGFMGFDWLPSYMGFYEDDNGVVQRYDDPDTITFFPEVTPEWYELLQGSYLIYPSPGIFTGADDAIASARKPYGMFSYATATNDPPGVKQVMGDTFLPVIKNPAVRFQFKTKF